MPLIRPAGSAAGWNARNVSAESLRWFSQRYTRLRYEDLTSDPASQLARLLDDSDGPPLRGPGEQPRLYHTVSGNPSRLEPGPLKVKTDLEWMSAMSGRRQFPGRCLLKANLHPFGYTLDLLNDGIGQGIGILPQYGKLFLDPGNALR